MVTTITETEKYLTSAEVSARWSGRISVKTLANWRCVEGMGPDFVRFGGKILYPLSLMVLWEKASLFRSTRDYRSTPRPPAAPAPTRPRPA
jgi:hypothetical protein